MSEAASRNTGLHVRWEKAGLVLDALPIPWNADAVIVEAIVRIPAKTPSDKHDFTLRLGDDACPAELLVRGDKRTPLRVLFRLPTPAQSCSAQLCWREHTLGQIEIPLIARSTFADSIALEHPAVQATIGTSAIACSAFVNAQAKQLHALAVVRAAGPLAAAQDLALRVEFEHGGQTDVIPAIFTSEQLRMRATLVSVPLPKPRLTRSYRIAWHVADRLLHAQTIRAVSKKILQQSLRISATRFIVAKTDGTILTLRSLPARDGQLDTTGVERVVPCFFVRSDVTGLAGVAPFTVRALVNDVPTTLGIEESMLITDGPTPILLGAVAATELHRIKNFSLFSGERNLGNLALLPAPAAAFTAEGGFTPQDDYLWSPAAEEQLGERLGKLLDGA